jgi:hypothetical protein
MSIYSHFAHILHRTTHIRVPVSGTENIKSTLLGSCPLNIMLIIVYGLLELFQNGAFFGLFSIVEQVSYIAEVNSNILPRLIQIYCRG